MMANEWLNDPERSKRVTQETAMAVGNINKGKSKTTQRGDFPEPDAVTIKVNGLTVRTEIEVSGDNPPEIFEALIRMAANMAVAKVLHVYWDNKDGNGEAA